jgi:hypothetical protein
MSSGSVARGGGVGGGFVDSGVSRRDFLRFSGGASVALGALTATAVTAPSVGAAWGLTAAAALPTEAGRVEASNMEQLGFNDLQARSAYQPVIHHHTTPGSDRWILYVGHHGGDAPNPITGEVEPNGTSIVDVTNPARPRLLTHIPGAPGGSEGGGAQMVRIVNGKSLTQADPNSVFMLRTFGNDGHQIYDVTDPSNPSLVTVLQTGLQGTHKNWWDETGIAFLVSDGRPEGWRTNRMTKIYDLNDPLNPRFIRNFGLIGQEPGATDAEVPAGLHGAIALGDRLYGAYGTSADGVVQIIDRDKLLNGDPNAADPFAPTRANLLYPQVGRLDMPPNWGGHTSFPVLGRNIADWNTNTRGQTRDFLVVTSESTSNECQEFRHLTFMVDITTESKPYSVATFEVPEAMGNFCTRGGRFGPHATSESFASPYYGKLIFVSYFNAGVRAVDIRNPFNPKEVGYFIPAVTDSTDKRCITVDGSDRCKVAIQTNNVEYDERGYIYIVDRANTGVHILRLTGQAAAMVSSA